MAENNNHHDDDYTGHDEGGGFAKGTNYRWLIIGGIVFTLMTWVMPIPESMINLAISRNQGDQLGVKTAMKHLFGEDAEPNTVRILISKAVIAKLNAAQINSLATKGKRQQAAMGLDVPGATSEHFMQASALMMQIPEEELTKAGQSGKKAAVELTLDSLTPEQKQDVEKSADHMRIIIALLTLCVIFFATEAIPLPAVALVIGLVQLFFGITPFQRLVGTYAHDAVWFIAGALMIGVTFVKFGLDKRVGMIMIKISGSSTRGIVAGLLVCTSIPTAFVGEHIIATMFLPIAIAIYTLSKRELDSPNLGKLLMMTIAFGCMIGGPASPTGGARNAIMIGFLSDYFGIEVSFIQWVKMGIIYTLVMIPLFAFMLPLIFKPEQRDLSYAVDMLKQDLAKHGKMTRDQWLVAGVLFMVIFLWITDKSIVHSIRCIFW